MSVRIYQLSKELEMTNKEVIALLKERGLDVSSPSNTIPNIYADSIKEEFEKKKGAKKEEPKEENKEEAPKEPAKPKLPAGQFVKSAKDIEAEKEAAKGNNGAAPKAAPSVPQPKTPPKKAPPAAIPPKPTTAGAAPKTPSVVTPPKGPAQPPTTPPPVTVPKKDLEEKESEETKAEEAAPTGELKPISCKPPIVVRDFAHMLDMKPFKLISELMEAGIFASMNQTLEEEVAIKVAQKHGFALEVQHRGEAAAEAPKAKKEEKVDESKFLEPRPPVVCVLGHVDHGKTTLLDTIRKASVVSGEAGGITQHIGAYQVEHNNHKITFIDTPGHAAFSKMRQRGADITDIAILVVAADDGFMPQTDEALKFAQKANVPVVVAINKMDAKGANPDKVKQQMQDRAIAPEEWGGETLCASISAIKGENIDALLELVLLQAEMSELKANPKCPAEGVIVESQVEPGRGSTATIIVQKGTLKVGDALVCGTEYCKVRAMHKDNGERMKQAGPATPALVLGWSGAPDAGSTFRVVKNEREAKREAEENIHEEKKETLAVAKSDQPMDLDNLFAAIQGQQEKTLKAIVKADVHGSVEAVAESLEAIKSDKVKLEIITAEVGLITKSDIEQAHAVGSIIVGFHTKLEAGAQPLAKHHNVRIIQHNIIYELITQVREAMSELLEPEIEESKLGAAEVRQVFKVTKGVVAGCMVTEGKIVRDSIARVLRKGQEEPVHEGKLSTLKRFKDDVNEVRAGYECGVQVSGFNGYQEGDVIECFEIKKIPAKL